MINQYIIDNDGIVYIGIKNVDNRFCYYISAIQRLHSSPTLTEALQNNQSSEKFLRYRIILKPIEIYSRVRVDNKYKINNVQEIYNELETELINTTNNLSEKLQHGGNPDHVLISLFLPAIYNVFGLEITKKVIHELYINPNRLNFLLYDNSRIHDFELTKDSSLNNELYTGFSELQKTLKNEPLKGGNAPFNFKISTMSIMFKDVYGQQSNYNGHALNIVKGTNDEGSKDLYIIDDSVGISPFQIYLERHADRIGYWEIKDATDELLQELQKYKGINIDKRLHRDVINITSSNSNLIGGDSLDDSEDESIKRYKEEIVNDCSWCPFISVKDVRENVDDENKQTIYGVIGGNMNLNSNAVANSSKQVDFSDTSGNDSSDTSRNEEQKSDSSDTSRNNSSDTSRNEEQKSDSSDTSRNNSSDTSGNVKNLQNNSIEPNKIESKPSKSIWETISEKYNNSPLNKYLTYAIVVLIVIIIIMLIVRRNNVKKNRKKIETYVNKIKDTRQKNVNLASQIIKAREVMEKPKKEVELILKAGQKDLSNNKFEMPTSKDKTEFFHPKIAFLQKYQSPINRYSGYNFSFKN